jgi:hypothetical protein
MGWATFWAIYVLKTHLVTLRTNLIVFSVKQGPMTPSPKIKTAARHIGFNTQFAFVIQVLLCYKCASIFGKFFSKVFFLEHQYFSKVFFLEHKYFSKVFFLLDHFLALLRSYLHMTNSCSMYLLGK